MRVLDHVGNFPRPDGNLSGARWQGGLLSLFEFFVEQVVHHCQIAIDFAS